MMEQKPDALVMPERRQSLAAMAVGYAAACATSAVVVAGHLAVDASIQRIAGASFAPNPLGVFFVVFGFGLLFGGLLCIPGFILLRGLLYWVEWRHWIAFCTTGAIFGGAFTMLMGPDDLALWWQYPPSPVFVIAGGVAGWAAWATENRFSVLRIEATEA